MMTTGKGRLSAHFRTISMYCEGKKKESNLPVRPLCSLFCATLQFTFKHIIYENSLDAGGNGD